MRFDPDRTEDVAIICDSNRHDLARSRHFWRPEGDDTTPPTLAGMRAMALAPKLLKLAEFVDREDFGIAATRKRAEHLARKIIAKATDDSVGRVA